MVHRSTRTPRQFEVHRHNDVWPQPTDRANDRASQLDPFNDQAVSQSEKLDMLDAVDTSFPARGKHIGNTLAVAGPARDRTRDSVLQVVRMSNDGNRVLPIVGKRLQAHGGMLREHTNRSRWLQ